MTKTKVFKISQLLVDHQQQKSNYWSNAQVDWNDRKHQRPNSRTAEVRETSGNRGLQKVTIQAAKCYYLLFYNWLSSGTRVTVYSSALTVVQYVVCTSFIQMHTHSCTCTLFIMPLFKMHAFIWLNCLTVVLLFTFIHLIKYYTTILAFSVFVDITVIGSTLYKA